MLTVFFNSIYNILMDGPIAAMMKGRIELSDYLNSTHYCDSLRLLVNNMVDCLNIGIVKIYRKGVNNFLNSKHKG